MISSCICNSIDLFKGGCVCGAFQLEKTLEEPITLEPLNEVKEELTDKKIEDWYDTFYPSQKLYFVANWESPNRIIVDVVDGSTGIVVYEGPNWREYLK